MRFQGQLLQIFSLICFVSLIKTKKLCDVRVWYLNLINDDVFDVDLTHDQIKLKTTIETLVMKASESRETRMLECSTLYLYNDMLKDLFNYTPSGSGMTLNEVESEDNLERPDNIVIDTDSKVTHSADHDIPNKQDKDQIEESLKNENMDDTEEKLDIDSFDTQTDEIVSNVHYDNNAADAVETLTEHSNTDDNTWDDTYNDKSFQTDNIDSLSTETDQLDETEYLDDTDPDLSTSDNFETDEKYHNVFQTDKEVNTDVYNSQASGLKIKAIPFGVCYSFGCLISDIFNIHRDGGLNKVLNDGSHRANASPSLLKRKSKLKCPLKEFCTIQCYYKFVLSKSFCMIDSINNYFISSVNNIEKTYTNMDSSQEVKENEKDHSEHMHSSIKALDIESLKSTSMDNSKVNTGKENSQSMDIVEKSSSGETHVKNKGLVQEFESLIEKKTRKYYSKIQHLEVMIVKLENQLLMEALNKQNHSSTITRLENQILKFENELLRMNKNYERLRTETENTNRRQHKYLELAYNEMRKEYPKLPDKSSKKFELISQHQTKINELGKLLRNQSNILMQLQKKHSHLEEQNKMLHEMVMNQTIFMNSIVKTVQDLSEQNIKNQKEISALRLKVDQNSVASDVSEEKANDNQDIIDELDTLVFDNLLKKSGSIRKVDSHQSTVKEDTSNRLKLKDDIGEKKVGASAIAKWCPSEIKTCPSCQYSPYVDANCLPFRNLFWSELKKTTAKEHTVEESDYPTVPDVIDAIEKSEHNIAKKADNNIMHDDKADQNENQKEENSAGASEDEKVSSEKEKITEAKEYKDFNKYILVGYDRDGKPVLKIREDLGGKTDTSEPISDDTKTKTETNPNNAPANDIKIEEITNNHIDHKTDGSQLEEDTLKTLDLRNSILTENKETINKEIVRITDSEKGKFINNDEVIEKSNDTADSHSENNDKMSDIFRRDPTIFNQNNESRNEIGVGKENKDKKSSIGQEQNKLSSTHNDNKENSKQQSGQDNKTVEINANGNNRKKINQLDSKPEGKPRERKTPLHIDKTKQSEPKDCYDIYLKGEKRDGLYKVTLLGSNKQIQVFCDMRRGGWTVIQRRQDGTTNFFQEWNEYKKGFGGLYGEHWLGNDNIHYLTNQDYYKLRVDLMDWEKTKKFAEFDYFLVDNEEDSYKLHIDGYTGDAGDGLTKHDGSKFSTKDVDNDRVVKEFGGSCAKRFYGAGWYYKCYASNLNGRFYKGGKIPEKRFDGITWKAWTGPNYSLKKVEMKVRPASAKN